MPPTLYSPFSSLRSGTRPSNPISIDSSPPGKMALSPAIAEHIQSINATMLSTGRYSDLILTCKGKEFKVHRCIVLPQSKPLAAAIDGGFKEAIDGKIDLEDEDPDIVVLFLKFLYTGDYDDNRQKKPIIQAAPEIPTTSRPRPPQDAYAALTYNSFITPSTSLHAQNPKKRVHETVMISPPNAKRQKPNDEVEVVDHNAEIALLTNTQVYIMAEKYDVQPLKTLAKIKYEELVNSNWGSQSFITTLRLLFDGTPESDPLMQVAFKTAGKYVKKLVGREEFATLCKECGELGFEILKTSLEDENKENEPTRCVWPPGF